MEFVCHGIGLFNFKNKVKQKFGCEQSNQSCMRTWTSDHQPEGFDFRSRQNIKVSETE